MKKTIQMLMIALMVMLSSEAAMAQRNNVNKEQRKISREQFAEQQANYIAYQLGLDDAAAAKFKATFMACEKEKWELAPKAKQGKKRHEMTEQELRELNEQRLEHSQKLLDIKKKYYKEYSKFLTQKQIDRINAIQKNYIDQLKARKKGAKGPRHNKKERQQEKTE